MVQRDWLIRSRDRWRSIASFWSGNGKAARSLLTYSLTRRRPYFFPLLNSFPCFFSLLAWLKLIWILFLLSSDENILTQIQICLSRKIYFTDPTYSLSIFHQKILLALAKTESIRDHSSINTRRTTIIFIRLLPPTTLLPRGETLLPTAFT